MGADFCVIFKSFYPSYQAEKIIVHLNWNEYVTSSYEYTNTNYVNTYKLYPWVIETNSTN